MVTNVNFPQQREFPQPMKPIVELKSIKEIQSFGSVRH
jgi:hypothetical protein